MKEDLKERINKILALLSADQKTKDIVEIINNPDNRNLIDYLEQIGSEKISFEIKDNKLKPQEMSGTINLWYKNSDKNWINKLWEIYRINN